MFNIKFKVEFCIENKKDLSRFELELYYFFR